MKYADNFNFNIYSYIYILWAWLFKSITTLLLHFLISLVTRPHQLILWLTTFTDFINFNQLTKLLLSQTSILSVIHNSFTIHTLHSPKYNKAQCYLSQNIFSLLSLLLSKHLLRQSIKFTCHRQAFSWMMVAWSCSVLLRLSQPLNLPCFHFQSICRRFCERPLSSLVISISKGMSENDKINNPEPRNLIFLGSALHIVC